MSLSQMEDLFLSHDELRLIDRQLRITIRSRLEAELRAAMEPALLNAVEEAMHHVSSRLLAYRDGSSLSDIVKLEVKLSLKVGDDTP